MKPVSRTFASGGVGVALSLLLAAQVTAASWSAPTTLASSDATHLNGIATLANGTVIVVYVECHPGVCYDVNVRRSLDGGQTWEPPTNLASSAYFASIAGRGSRVDVVWTENRQLMYARSTDSGGSFANPRRLADIRGGETGVARGPGGVVAVAWTQDFDTGNVKARVSVDGGKSFGTRQTVAAASDDVGNHVAVGDGVIYVAYSTLSNITVKRSLDFGATWITSTVADDFGGYEYQGLDIAAEGDNAYLIYRASNGSIRMRRTDDGGQTWLPDVVVNGRDRLGHQPSISVHGGIVRVVYNASDGLFYRQSTNGQTFSAAESISEIGGGGEVAFADRVIVPYNAFLRPGESDVRVRTRV